MNKLMGFFEMKDLRIPTIPWKEYDVGVKLDPVYLWTIRTAVYRGDDLNLPRKVGVDSNEAEVFAKDLKMRLGDRGLVVYYPYFIAEKSGTLNIFNDKCVIEAVKDDLWNLVTYSDREVTIIYTDEDLYVDGNESFLTEDEINEITSYVRYLRNTFRDDLLDGKSILLEWSYAYNCDRHKQTIDQRYLVFYEVRTV